MIRWPLSIPARQRHGATYLGRIAGFYPERRPAGFIASIIGAIVLLVIYHPVTRTQ